MFKNELGTEKYVELFMPKKYRSALCKFRYGVAPIRIETRRYERLNVTDRICNICDNHDVSDVCSDFHNFSLEEIVLFLFGNDSMVYKFAKTCYDILARRRSVLHK